MQNKKISTRLRIEILSNIDELNQYLNGYVTNEALKENLQELISKL